MLHLRSSGPELTTTFTIVERRSRQRRVSVGLRRQSKSGWHSHNALNAMTRGNNKRLKPSNDIQLRRLNLNDQPRTQGIL